jgi:hypothetical protein
MRPMALSVFVLTLLPPLGCKSANGEGGGSSGASTPAHVNTDFATRDPRQCTGFTAQPSVADATILVQCTMDGKSSG